MTVHVKWWARMDFVSRNESARMYVLITLARSAIFCSEFSSFTSAMMIGMDDKSLPALLPISFNTSFNFSSFRPATPHDKFSSNLTPS